MLRFVLSVFVVLCTTGALFVIAQGILAILDKYGYVMMFVASACISIAFLGIAQLIDKRNGR